MGAGVAKADTGDLAQTYTPTESCPISKVEFEPQSDGQLNLKVTVNLDVLKNAGHTNGEYYYSMEAKNLTINSYLGGEEGNVAVNGERVFEFSAEKRPNHSLTWNQEFSFKYSLFDQNPQLDPDPINNPTVFKCTAPSPFTGFNVEHIAGDSGDRVDVEYKGYHGRLNDSMNNIFLRENLSAGTIRMLGVDDTSHYREDTQFTPATTYTYYVVKSRALYDLLPDFWRAVDSKEMAFSAEERTKLQTISAFKTITLPAPRIVTVNSLKVSPSVRSASLTWQYDYETIQPNVTGFHVRIYRSNGSLYKEYKNTSQTSSNCSAKYSIPYIGTYYFTVTPYFVYNGKTYTGTATAKVACKSKSLSAASGSVTKISDKKARITIKKATGSTGTMVYQYVSGKWKYIGKTTGSAYTVTKNTAGKRKYKLLSYIVENSKTYKASKYSSTYSPKANVAKFSYSNYPSSYTQLSHFWRPNTISYSGSKVVVSGKFINTHLYTLKYCKIKLTVTCQGKVIGTKTINSGKLKSNQVKKVTVKLDKSKTGYDLRACFVGWDYKVISYH